MKRNDIENVLIEIGTPIGITGFNYIVDAILLLDKPEWKNPKWTALYHCIGSLYDVSAAIVESAIRHAFKLTRNNKLDYKKVEHYIGFINCENSNSLMQLYKRMKQEETKENTNITRLMLKETLLELISS